MKKGKWIAIEGADGVGKTTLRAEIQDWLLAKNINVLNSREPGGSFTEANKYLRASIFAEEEWSPKVDWLFLADHILNKAGAAHYLRQGYWVLQDRCGLSQLAYAAVKNGGDPFVNREIERSLQSAPFLDLVVILYGDPETLVWRLEKEKGRQEEAWLKKEASYFEEMEERYREGAKRVFDESETDYIFLDSTKESVEVLARKVIGLLLENESEEGESR